MNHDIINGLVHNRISKTDCLVQGCVLDGFPKNMDQVDLLQKGMNGTKYTPSFIVVLELSDEECLKRLKERKIDPVSGNVYGKNGQDAET